MLAVILSSSFRIGLNAAEELPVSLEAGDAAKPAEIVRKLTIHRAP